MGRRCHECSLKLEEVREEDPNVPHGGISAVSGLGGRQNVFVAQSVGCFPFVVFARSYSSVLS